MLARSQIVERLIAIRGGVVSTQELAEAGIPTSSIRLGVKHGWTRLGHGLWYLKPGEPDFHTWVEAGRLAFGEDSIIGSAASLFIRGLIDRAPEVIEFWIPQTKSFYPIQDSPLKPKRDHIERLLRRDPNSPFSSIADSLCDYLNSLNGDIEAASAIITCRKRAPRVATDIQAVVSLRKRQRHRDLLDYLFACDPPFDSVLEYLWVINVEVPHKITPTVRQWRCPDGYLRDGAWIELKSIIELDGDAYHNNPSTMKRDRAKDNAATRRGFTTYRFSYADIAHQACATASTLAQSISGLSVSPCSAHCWVNRD